MIFHEFGSRENPTIIMLHGGGLSDWSLDPIVKELVGTYHMVTPIIDGHGENGKEEFTSIADCATKLIAYIDDNYNGQVYALTGLSLGAQIVTEVLSRRETIAKYAVIESALIYPLKATVAMTKPLYEMCYGLIQKRWFANLQAKTLCVPKDKVEKYYQDSLLITKQSLIRITISNGNFLLQPEITKTRVKVLIIVGEKELCVMRKSAAKLHELIPENEYYIAPKLKHGEISLLYPQRYVAIFKKFVTKVNE